MAELKLCWSPSFHHVLALVQRMVPRAAFVKDCCARLLPSTKLDDQHLPSLLHIFSISGPRYTLASKLYVPGYTRLHQLISTYIPHRQAHERPWLNTPASELVYRTLPRPSH